jgi:hypothetical protein
MLYPLSYEGGDGAERGAKLGATARKPWGKGSSGVLGRSKVGSAAALVDGGYVVLMLPDQLDWWRGPVRIRRG